MGHIHAIPLDSTLIQKFSDLLPDLSKTLEREFLADHIKEMAALERTPDSLLQSTRDDIPAVALP